MNELQELYQQLIIDHGSHPRNFCCLESADCVEEGYNPLCGDKIKLYLKLVPSLAASHNTEDQKQSHHLPQDLQIIAKASFEGSGCAISLASASLMTEALTGLTTLQAGQLFDDFHQLLTDQAADDEALQQKLGKLMVLAGVKAFPMRVKCATLAWHTLIAAIRKY